jgi:hypothetical protein
MSLFSLRFSISKVDGLRERIARRFKIPGFLAHAVPNSPFSFYRAEAPRLVNKEGRSNENSKACARGSNRNSWPFRRASFCRSLWNRLALPDEFRHNYSAADNTENDRRRRIKRVGARQQLRDLSMECEH